MDKLKWQSKTKLRWLTLFITSGTLLCCALPVLLVSLGFGAVVASLNYNIPGLFFLAEHKLWALSISGLLLTFLAASFKKTPFQVRLASLSRYRLFRLSGTHFVTQKKTTLSGRL